MKKIIKRKSHGTGRFKRKDFYKIGRNVVIEEGVLVFHPGNIEIEDSVYIGHNTILKGYYKNKMIIGSSTWIGQQCFFHGAGGIEIGKNIGIGPGVTILTSFHTEEGIEKSILHSRIEFQKVIIEDDSDIGAGTIILPGVKISKGTQIGAGAVVTKNTKSYSVVAGVPAKLLKMRPRQSRKKVRNN